NISKNGYAVIPGPHGTSKTATYVKRPPYQIASAGKNKGVIIDYIVLDSTQPDPMVFQGDTTYFVSDAVICNDAIIEGGAIFKFPNNGSADIEVDGNLTCDTASYRPAVFTAGDDNSVGDSMSGVWSGYSGTVSGYYASPALFLNDPNNV